MGLDCVLGGRRLKWVGGGVVGVALLSLALLLLLPHLESGDGSGRSLEPSPQHLTTCGASGGASGGGPQCDIRLHPNVIPLHYDLYLFPNISSGHFTGRVSIVVEVRSSVPFIRLHTKYLNISATTLRSGGRTFPVTGEEDLDREFWVIGSGEEIGAAKYELELEFGGSLTRGIVGFYRSTYQDNATSKFVVSTKFQPTYARRAFPCFDEPGFKSTFSVSIVKPSHLTALSNMPQAEERVDVPVPGLTTVRFQKSVPMVTYLVAVAVGDFEFREAFSRRGIPVRIYSRAELVGDTEYASNVTSRILDYFEQYFGIPYPLPKLDLVGIPDFVSGAMEHWGMISFRESNLLLRQGLASAGNKQRVASVIAHELGMNGTCDTVLFYGDWRWNDLWLNEGFASYMEYKGMESVEGGWEMGAQFVSQDLSPVLRLDSSPSSHPILQEVWNPNQITEIFDRISYSKGASILRMLEQVMGEGPFRQGISTFLANYSFKSAVTGDLWEELQRAAGPDAPYNISQLMGSWTGQAGYPLLKLEEDGAGGWRISQQPFRSKNRMRDPGHASPHNYTWTIPLTIKNRTLWMGDDGKPVGLGSWRGAGGLNGGQFGYYRVQYRDEMYGRFVGELGGGTWSPAERCGLFDDAFALSFASHLKYGLALELAVGLEGEEHYVPWHCAQPHLNKLRRLIASSLTQHTYHLYQTFVIRLLRNIYEKLSWTDGEGDKHLDRLLKGLIFGLACESGHKGCLQKTRELFEGWMRGEAEVPTSLRDLVYKWGGVEGERWEELWDRYSNQSDPQERIRLLKALAFSKEGKQLERLLERSKNESLVRRQDFFTLLKFISANPVGNPIVWNFYRDEQEYLVKRFTVNNKYLGRLILDITEDFGSEAQLGEVEGFLARYPEGGAGARARDSALDNLNNNIGWARKNGALIEQWLLDNVYDNES